MARDALGGAPTRWGISLGAESHRRERSAAGPIAAMMTRPSPRAGRTRTRAKRARYPRTAAAYAGRQGAGVARGSAERDCADVLALTIQIVAKHSRALPWLDDSSAAEGLVPA
jgi:hypothetical protein